MKIRCESVQTRSETGTWRPGTGSAVCGSACPLNRLVEYCRLLTTVNSRSPDHQALSSVGGMGPIRDARPGNLAGMHAIGGVLGQNNPGTDARKCEWLIRSVFKEE
jgi:hypothetical protein